MAATDLDVTTGGALRQVMRRYPTGVTVVTTRTTAGQPVALTVSSFTSLSLDPPLVLWCLRNGSACRDDFIAAEYFAVNILAADQRDIAHRFAGPVAERFTGVTWSPGKHGLPMLARTTAWLVCRRHGEFPGGDHVILVGSVEECMATDDPPLLLFDGRMTAPPTACGSEG